MSHRRGCIGLTAVTGGVKGTGVLADRGRADRAGPSRGVRTRTGSARRCLTWPRSPRPGRRRRRTPPQLATCAAVPPAPPRPRRHGRRRRDPGEDPQRSPRPYGVHAPGHPGRRRHPATSPGRSHTCASSSLSTRPRVIRRGTSAWPSCGRRRLRRPGSRTP